MTRKFILSSYQSIEILDLATMILWVCTLAILDKQPSTTKSHSWAVPTSEAAEGEQFQGDGLMSNS